MFKLLNVENFKVDGAEAASTTVENDADVNKFDVETLLGATASEAGTLKDILEAEAEVVFNGNDNQDETASENGVIQVKISSVLQFSV